MLLLFGVACKVQDCRFFESSDPGSESEAVKSKNKKKKKPKKKTKKAQAKEQKPKKTDKKNKKEAHPDGNAPEYKAGNYGQSRLAFIRARMSEQGLKFREASKLWESSEERSKILQGMSRSELLRRRFIPPLKASKGGA